MSILLSASELFVAVFFRLQGALYVTLPTSSWSLCLRVMLSTDKVGPASAGFTTGFTFPFEPKS